MRVFVTADMHMGHENIIAYERRTLYNAGVNQMNEDLIRRWNSVVREDDVVYHLGDFAYGKGSKQKIPEWESRLIGHKIWISGNHYDPAPSMDAAILNMYGFCFVMLHDPNSFAINVSSYDTDTMWLLHGHNHGHRPLIDTVTRSSCVSVENINYTPMLLTTLSEKIRVAIREDGW